MSVSDSCEVDLGLQARIEKEQEAHYSAIGKVAANWAFFESNIDSWSIKLAELPLLSATCLTAQIAPAARKLDAFIALVDTLCDDTSKLVHRLHNFAKDVASLGEQRNRTVHDPWLLISPKENAKRFEITAKRKLRAVLVTVPTEQVLKLADNIKTLDDRFTELAREAYGARVQPLPDTKID